jgi:hypothetical protein
MAIAPLRDHCKHGVKFALDNPGVLVNQCWQCEDEKKNRDDAIKQKQSADLWFVKNNFLQLLATDKEFRDKVKEILSI